MELGREGARPVRPVRPVIVHAGRARRALEADEMNDHDRPWGWLGGRAVGGPVRVGGCRGVKQACNPNDRNDSVLWRFCFRSGQRRSGQPAGQAGPRRGLSLRVIGSHNRG